MGSEFSMIYFAPLSLMSSSLLIALIAIAQNAETIKMRKDHISNIGWMTFSDFGYNIRCMLPLIWENPPPKSIFCQLSAIFGIFFQTATQSWFFMIGLQIFISVWWKNTPRWVTHKCFRHLYVWILSIIVIIIPINMYGHETDNATCWITTHNAYQLVIILPTAINLLFTCFLFCLTCCTLSPVLNVQLRVALLLRTLAFILAFIIAWSFTWTAAIYKITSWKPPTWLDQAALATSTAYGVMNFVVWTICFSDIRRILKHIYENKKRIKNSYGQKTKLTSVNSSLNASLLTRETTDWDDKGSDIPSDYTATYKIPITGHRKNHYEIRSLPSCDLIKGNDTSSFPGFSPRFPGYSPRRTIPKSKSNN